MRVNQTERPPWQLTRAEAEGAYSVHRIREPLQAAVQALIQSHPLYPRLRRRIERYQKALWGTGQMPTLEPDEALEEIFWNEKSSTSKALRADQLQIAKELDIKLLQNRTFRGFHINWHRVSVKQALTTSQRDQVPAHVLAEYPDLQSRETTGSA